MRFTLGALGDLEIDAGTTLGQCRPELASLAGVPELITVALSVDGIGLAEEQVAGVPPWVPGCLVVVGTGPPDAVREAAAAPWHLAVVSGPDAGTVAAPGRDNAVVVGRDGCGPGILVLSDPAVSRTHLVVRSRPRGGWRVRDQGSANGSALLRRGRRRPLLWSHRLRPDDRLQAGTTVLALRPRERPSPPATEPAPHRQPLGSLLVPAAMSAALAAMMRNPLFLMLALAGPFAALAPTLRRRRRPPGAPALGPDPAAASLLTGTGKLPRWCELARAGLAVVGEEQTGLAVARGLLGGALLETGLRLTLLQPPEADGDWAWCRWLERRLGPPGSARVGRDRAGAQRALGAQAGAVLVVSHGCRRWRTELDRWWLSVRTPDDAVLVLETSRAAVPAWCSWVLTAGPAGTVTLEGPDGVVPLPSPAASAGWVEAHARRVASRDAATHDGSPDLPGRVALADLGLPDDVPAVLGEWGPTVRPLPAVVATVGIGRGGAVTTVDLLADGPHALVAGTTGSGKSELLQSLLLSLALRHPPTELAFALLDYKGGTSFGACADLPHVVGQVTDLDPPAAVRALEGLRCELRRREALLADAGVPDLESLRDRSAARGDGAPPRLLVVVDEFRALSEELPDFVPGLVRLAAQGRSLGIHLMLATQRPGGAVSAQMRANLALRFCLRVTEATDSVDVVEVPDAAALPPGCPGRAILRRGGGPVETVQTAWAAPDRATSTAQVRWAPPWSDYGRRTVADPKLDHAQHLVQVVRAAARARGSPAPNRLWPPPLPAVVRAEQLPAGRRTDALRLGLVEVPGAADWQLLESEAAGVLLVVGRASSGRTNTLAVAARAALAGGRGVHVVAGTAASAARIVGSVASAGVGTVVTAADPRRLARLLTLLLARPRRCLLVVDDVALVGQALDRMPRGAAADLLDRVLREGPHHGLAIAASAGPIEAARLLPHSCERIVLAVADPHDDVLLGVPRELSSGREPPGRGVHLRPGRAARCQVALLGPPDTATRQPGTADRPWRLLELPLWTPDAQPLPPGAIGLCGDTCEPLTLDVESGALVVGPAASGRSTALLTLTRALRAAGRQVAVVCQDGPLADAAPAQWSATPAGAAQLLRRCVAAARGGQPTVLVVDDLDLLTRAAGSLDETLTGYLSAAEAGDTKVPRVVAAARTDRLVAAYRGACATLRGSAPLLVLTPFEPGSSEVAGQDLSLHVDPAHPRYPGRGVLVHRGRVTPVQLADG